MGWEIQGKLRLCLDGFKASFKIYFNIIDIIHVIFSFYFDCMQRLVYFCFLLITVHFISFLLHTYEVFGILPYYILTCMAKLTCLEIFKVL